VTSFAEVFGHESEARASAPGRVNLLGEHTDYNDGYVLPSAIPQCTTVELAVSRSGRFEFHAADLAEHVVYRPGEEAPGGFARYLFGCVEMLREQGHAIEPFAVLVRSDVPIGAGLSSSDALKGATLRALRARFALPALAGDRARQRRAAHARR
jgi:galactokinase